jgi:hypothetical protein
LYLFDADDTSNTSGLTSSKAPTRGETEGSSVTNESMPREIVKKQLVDEQSVRELKGYVKYTLWRSVKFTPRNLFTDEPTVLDSLMKRMGYKTSVEKARRVHAVMKLYKEETHSIRNNAKSAIRRKYRGEYITWMCCWTAR